MCWQVSALGVQKLKVLSFLFGLAGSSCEEDLRSCIQYLCEHMLVIIVGPSWIPLGKAGPDPRTDHAR